VALPRRGLPNSAATRRLAAVVSGAVLLAALGAWLGGWLVEIVASPAWPAPGSNLRPIWIAMILAYVLAMALPFVPGIEIGLALMLLLGVDGIVLVYAGTQMALVISYLCGRFLPMQQLLWLMNAVQPRRARVLLECIDTPSSATRLACLASHAPAPWLKRLLRHRYLALAVALNLPGNAILGGAGGIALFAGNSRLFGFLPFSLLTAVATSPVPLLLLLCEFA
jgi:hypothetical protein